jgi:hypothetical protein
MRLMAIAIVTLLIDTHLTYCAAHIAACEDRVAQVSFALALEYMSGVQYCPPEGSDSTRQARAVLDWHERRWIGCRLARNEQRPPALAVRASVHARRSICHALELPEEAPARIFQATEADQGYRPRTADGR